MSDRLRDALAKYRERPINADDDPRSWEALNEVLGAADEVCASPFGAAGEEVRLRAALEKLKQHAELRVEHGKYLSGRRPAWAAL